MIKINNKFFFSLISLKIILISVLFGLVSMLTIYFGVRFYIPGTEALSDPREIINTIGSAITGPIGSIIIGFISALADPPLSNKIHTIFQHICSALWIGFSYKYLVYKKSDSVVYLFNWILLIFIYYFIVYIPPFYILYKFYHHIFIQFMGKDSGFFEGYWMLIQGWVPEYIFTTAYSLLILIATPHYYKKPLWGKEIIIDDNNYSHNSLINKFISKKFLSFLSIRLSLWFLLLLTIPILLISIFVRNYFTELLVDYNSHYQYEISREIAIEMSEKANTDLLSHISDANNQKGSILLIMENDSISSLTDSFSVKLKDNFLSNEQIIKIKSQKKGKICDDKKIRAIGFHFVKNSDKIVLSISPDNFYQKAIADFSNVTYPYLVLSMIIIAFFSVFVIWIIVGNPILKLKKAADEIARNNLDFNFETKEIPDEIHLLANSLNKMKDSLVENAIKLKNEAIQNIRLESEKKRFASLLERITKNMNDIIFQIDIECNIIYITSSLKNVTGFSPEDFQGKEISELIDPDFYNIFNEKINSVISEKHPVKLEIKLKNSNGDFYWFEMIINYFVNENSSFNLILSAREITERKIIEYELAERNKFINSILDNLPNSILVFNFNGEILYHNQLFDKITGWPHFNYKNLKELISLMFPDEATQLFLFNKVQEAVNNKGNLIGVRALKSITQFGDSKYLALSHYVIPDTEFVITILEDITNLTLLEKELKLSEEKFRTIFEQSLNGVCLISEKGKIIEWNNSLTKLTGFNRDNVINSDYKEVFSSLNISDTTLKNLLITEISKGLETEISQTFYNIFELNITSTLNEIKTIHLTIFSIKTDMEFRIAAIARDITKQKENELLIKLYIKELESKNKELESFTYTVSHDLRSPILTIKGFTGLIIQDIEKNRLDRLVKDANRIVDASDKMQNLLDDLLELSRIGRIINPSSEFSVSDIAKESKELLTSLIANDIEITIEDNMPKIFADKVRIRQVYQNLIENSIKYRNINIKTEINIGYYKENNSDVFFVKDNGLGIKKEYFDRIFGLFQKLNSNSDGTGIGLALVKRIIELHGGKVWVESTGENQGTTFFFTFV